MITFDNVTKIYNDNVGLENASIKINDGEFVFLVGPSGAGKSTFIKLILKEVNADSGSIVVDGQEVTKLSNREIPMLRRKIGIVFQDFRLLPKKTVFENVAFALETVHKSSRRVKNRVPVALDMVGIGDKANNYPDELSAGEQQRVAIARAIINNPDLLICDEPTGNLDPDTANGIMDLLAEINETGTTIVMVTHAKDIVDRMRKRVVAIDSGHIVRDEYGDYGYSDGEEVQDAEDRL
jgi:cell division ATP-binding protein ftsE